MNEERKRLALKGRNQNSDDLFAQARAATTQARVHELGTKVVSIQDKLKLAEQLLTELETTASLRSKMREEGLNSTRVEVALKAEAKEFANKCWLAAPMIVRDLKLDLDPNVFGGRLGDQTPNIAGHLIKIRPHVERLEEPLKNFFNGESPTKKCNDLHAKLTNANTTQETLLENLPAETLDFYAKKGQLLELVEDINRSARIAFYGRAEIASQFNKDLLLRSRRAGGKATQPKPTEVKATV